MKNEINNSMIDASKLNSEADVIELHRNSYNVDSYHGIISRQINYKEAVELINGGKAYMISDQDLVLF